MIWFHLGILDRMVVAASNPTTLSMSMTTTTPPPLHRVVCFRWNLVFVIWSFILIVSTSTRLNSEKELFLYVEF